MNKSAQHLGRLSAKYFKQKLGKDGYRKRMSELGKKGAQARKLSTGGQNTPLTSI